MASTPPRKPKAAVGTNNEGQWIDKHGKICSWNGNSEDAAKLRGLIESENISAGMTAAQVAASFPLFAKYANPTLNSALTGIRTAIKKERDDQARAESGAGCEFSSFALALSCCLPSIFSHPLLFFPSTKS